MSQRMRRNVAPSTTNVTKQGPLRAVIAFSLKNSSPASRSSNSSPTTRDTKGSSDRLRSARKSPDYRLSPERKSPGSPVQKEKSRPHHQSPVQYLSVSGWRASSADALVPYLTGQWPKDVSSCHRSQTGGVFMCDKSTQTVDNTEHITDKKKSKGHRRSASFGHGDLSKEVIRQKLQKTKEGSRSEWIKQRWSPVTGVHSALSLTAPPAVFAQSKANIIPHFTHIRSKQNMSRYQHSSVEGLNVEIEKLVLSKSGAASISGHDSEDPEILKAHDVPDGRRAPIPEVTRPSSTRSVDTQTPSGHLDDLVWTLSAIGSDSISPRTPKCAPGHGPDLVLPDSRPASVESKSSKGDSDPGSPEPSKFVSSPKPEKSCPFVREPPDGCEKVKVIEEMRKPSIKEPLFFPVKPQFVFKQSQDSAFCPLIKQYLGESGDRPTL